MPDPRKRGGGEKGGEGGRVAFVEAGVVGPDAEAGAARRAGLWADVQVSANGEALTETGSAVEVSEKVVAVYDRQ